MHRAFSASAVLLIGGLAGITGALSLPCRYLQAQTSDSTGMPPLDQLALAAGRESRRHPIRAVAHTMLCEPSHPLADSASLAACVALDSVRAAAITASFARGLDVPMAATRDSGAEAEIPACPADVERVAEPRVLIARLMAPIVGMQDGHWEGRLTVELRCRSPGAGSSGGVRIMGKEYLYQWSGHEWKLYQFAWLRG